jgi:hypothetical protein
MEKTGMNVVHSPTLDSYLKSHWQGFLATYGAL